MFKSRKGSRGFTLMELMVVVSILAVLMAVVVPAVTGTKSVSLEGQVKSDGKSTQTAVDNFNNKSIKTGQFPEVALSALGHAYSDVYGAVASGGAILRNKDGTKKGASDTDETLGSTITKPGTTTTVAKRTMLNFAASTDTYDSSGAVKTAKLVPDFLQKDPSSIILMGDESKSLGASDNKLEEFLWLLLVNAPGSDQESRTVEIYRLTDAQGCAIATDVITCGSLIYTQIF